MEVLRQAKLVTSFDPGDAMTEQRGPAYWLPWTPSGVPISYRHERDDDAAPRGGARPSGREGQGAAVSR